MVLTRSERNRLLSLGFDEAAIMNMEGVPRTTVVTLPTLTPVVTSVPAVTTTSVVMTPAERPYVAVAGDLSGSPRGSDTSVTTPDYSSITARNGGQRPGQAGQLQQPSQREGAARNGDIVGELRNEFSRQMEEFRRSLQEIARTVSQQVGQSAANYNAPAPAHTPSRTMAETIDYDDALGNNYHSAHFRPVRAPQYARDAGVSASPFNMQQDYPSSSGNRIDLAKWGLKFDGTSKSMSAEDFMFRLDVLRRDYNCSFSEVLRSFHLLLEGQALNWYWNLRKLTPLHTWHDLEAAFLTQYRRFESEFQVQKKIMDRRQMPQESFEDFYNAVIRLRNQQRSPYSEADLVEIMRSNLKPALSHLLFSLRISTLSEFCQQAKRAESLLSNQRPQYQQRNFVPQRVSELEYEGSGVPDMDLDVEALAENSRYTCWNCRQEGHSFVDCPSTTRRIFCFRCGRDGVVTPKCPRCQGNATGNKSRPGQTRSTQT